MGVTCPTTLERHGLAGRERRSVNKEARGTREGARRDTHVVYTVTLLRHIHFLSTSASLHHFPSLPHTPPPQSPPQNPRFSRCTEALRPTDPRQHSWQGQVVWKRLQGRKARSHLHPREARRSKRGEKQEKQGKPSTNRPGRRKRTQKEGVPLPLPWQPRVQVPAQQG